MTQKSNFAHSGWLNIYKPRGISSNKILSYFKRQFKFKKIGHAGTLDPEAEGILPIAINEATKLTGYMMDAKKAYKFLVQFGKQTATGDIEGEIIAESNKAFPTQTEIESILKNFIGEIEQIPHKYSAIKVNGKRSYELSRANEDFQLNSRKINIYDLKLTNYDQNLGQAEFITECSKGTYIRVLAEDIAKSLQNYGFVLRLARLKVGSFSEDRSLNLDISKDFAEPLEKYLINIDYILDDILVINVAFDEAKEIYQGKKVFFANTANCDLVAIKYSNILLAIGEIKNNFFDIKRVFNLINFED